MIAMGWDGVLATVAYSTHYYHHDGSVITSITNAPIKNQTN